MEQLCSVQALMESSLGEQRSAIDLAETLRGELDGLAASVVARMDAYEDLAGTVECKASALQERLSGVEDWGIHSCRGRGQTRRARGRCGVGWGREWGVFAAMPKLHVDLFSFALSMLYAPSSTA